LPPLEDLGALVESEPATDQIEHLEPRPQGATEDQPEPPSAEQERLAGTA